MPTPTTRSLTLAVTLATLTSAGLAQEWRGRSYGSSADEESGLVSPLQVALEYDAVELSGGRPGAPAGFFVSSARDEHQLAGGKTLLVSTSGMRTVHGRFDSAGRLVLDLADVPEALTSPVYTQGFALSTDNYGRRGFALTGGLAVEWLPAESEESGEQEGGANDPPLSEILVEEIVDLFDGQLYEQAIALALNSDGDGIAFEIAGELQIPVPNPFVPTLALGGAVSFSARIARSENQVNEAVYDIVIGRDVAATAGVSAGPAGLGASAGVGGDAIWRVASPAEVVYAIQCMVILQCIGDDLSNACRLIDQHTAVARKALDDARRVADKARDEFRRLNPFARTEAFGRLDALADREIAAHRQRVDAGTKAVETIIGIVADARTFMDEHIQGMELRGATGLTGSVGIGGYGDADTTGEVEMANIGANISASYEREEVWRLGRVPETGGLFIEHTYAFTDQVSGGAGFVVGVSGQVQKVLELTQRDQFDADGHSYDQSGITVRLSLDAELAGALGVVATADAAIGGEFYAEMKLEDLLDFAPNGIATLLGDKKGKAAKILRSIPITLGMQIRYTAGFGVGLGIDLGKEYFSAGVGASVTYTDAFLAVEYQGGNTSNAELAATLQGGPLDQQCAALLSKLEELNGEVARVALR